MRAAVLRQAAGSAEQPLEICDVPEPRPGPGQVAIRVEACGVCRTGLHIVEGDVGAALPLILGHQAAGRIIDRGAGVSGFDAGQLVGVGWLSDTCVTCGFCTSGRENLCHAARLTGRDVNGGFAEVMVADARFAFPLPTSLSAVDAAPLLCAGIIGYRSLRLSEINPGGRLGLAGFGASAHLAIQVARYWGCEVYAFAREEHHRQLALDLGAVWAGETSDDPGVPLDAAIIFAPAGELVPQMLRRLDRGGTLAVNAIRMTDVPAFRYDDLYWERTVRSVANFTRRDAIEFLKLASEIPVRAEIERFPLARVNDALARIKRGGVHGAAVIEMP
jgi:propanol-preferring alcohol dehydrogenase